MDIYGNTAAYYEYDAFGNVLEASGSHANVNPLRYRGYVYDHECNLYYLQSRYYDPSIGRFINADAYASTGQGILGHNMFAYCLNTPTGFKDEDGHFANRPHVGILIGKHFIHNSQSESAASEADENILEKWEKEGVFYISNSGDYTGGRIVNSWKITDSMEMYEYALYLKRESPYQNDFAGSADGIVFEWMIHNMLYNYGPSFWKGNAKDVDLGNTIFDDDHPILSSLMWELYRATFPKSYESDFLVYLGY